MAWGLVRRWIASTTRNEDGSPLSSQISWCNLPTAPSAGNFAKAEAVTGVHRPYE